MTTDIQPPRGEIARCPSCGAELELDRTESASGQIVCPECGVGFSIPITEQESGPTLHLSDPDSLPQVVPSSIPLFTERAIGIATAIGGPLAGAFLMAKNFRSLHREGAARLTLTIGTLFSLCLFTALAFLPEVTLDEIPRGLLPLFFGIVGYVAVRSFQQGDIEVHLAAGGKKGSWLFIVGSGILSTVVSMGYLWLLFLLTPGDAPEPVFSGTPLTFESNGGTLYYDSPRIQKSDAMALGKVLEEMGYFSKETQLSAAFHLDQDKYTVELLVDEENWTEPVVRHNITQCVRILRHIHPQREYQFVFVMFDSTGRRKSTVFHSDS